MAELQSFFANLTIWTGATVGFLKVVDWLLSTSQKTWLTDKAETAWFWLSEQRVGKFTAILRRSRLQTGFALFAHLSIIIITLAFLGRVFLGWSVNASLELGKPRLYEFQVWVDVAALLISAGFVSWKIHPRIAKWIGTAPSLKCYFGRSAMALGLCVLAAFAFLLLMYPIAGFDSPLLNEDDPEKLIAAYESMLGGKQGVIAVHALSALIAAPIMAEWMLVQTILFLSFYWLILVWVAIFLFRVFQFILLRIVESSNGPVLALSGFLIGLGAIVKAITS
ncbi:MAG: hypothetical protein F6K10_19590 [Moorea sp. SIO2B7]|nr:hypothetical protein [Moorena sp. SIO2B7]